MSANLVLTGRCMYPSVHQPRSFQGDEPRYELTLVIPQNDPQVQQIAAAASEICRNELDGIQPTPANWPLKVDPSNELVAGCYVIRCRGKNQPGVVDQNVQPILNASCPADGDYVRVDMALFPYNTKGNKGVGVGLNNVQFLGAGPGRLGKSAARKPEEVFPVEVMPQQQVPQQQVPGMQQPVGPPPGMQQPQQPLADQTQRDHPVPQNLPGFQQ